MKIRITASYDLVRRIQKLINNKSKIYPNKGSNDEYRLYLDVDDRDSEQWIDLFETTEFPIEIDPRDFR